MYSWLWRRLPGPAWAKALQCAALIAVSIVVLFGWVFPWLEVALGINDVTVASGVLPLALGTDRRLEEGSSLDRLQEQVVDHLDHNG